MEAKTNRVDRSRFSSLGMKARRSGRAFSFARCGGMQQGGWAMRTGALAMILGTASLAGGCGEIATQNVGPDQLGPDGSMSAPEDGRSGSGSSGGTGTGSSGWGGSGSFSGTGSSAGTGSGTPHDAGCDAPNLGWVFCEGEWRSGRGGRTGVEPPCPANISLATTPCVSCITCSSRALTHIWGCTEGMQTDEPTADPCWP
jgi:hypothetical protein